MTRSLLLFLALIALSCDSDTPTAPSAPTASFFVTSTTSVTGNLGGLTGADSRCQSLAQAVGLGNRTWRAYLSVERDPVNGNVMGRVGHSDGMGPNQSTAGALSSWNSAHTNQSCANTAPGGGAGRIYCFAR